MLDPLFSALGSFFRAYPVVAYSATAALVASIAILVVGAITNWPPRQGTGQQGQGGPSVQGSPGSVNVQGNTIVNSVVHIYQNGQLVPPPVSPAAASLPAAALPVVENGGFEYGTAGWGTGFFESYFASPGGAALMFNNAVARWYIDDRNAHTGKWALHIEQSSTQAADVFSSFSQRIKVKPAQRYQVKYWAYLESTDGRGSFSLRVLPSRRIEPREWDRFKRKIDASRIGAWQEVRLEFESGSDTFFDLRFAAETAMKLFVDDVTVIPVSPN